MRRGLILVYVSLLLMGISVLYLSNKVQTVENRQALILEEINDLKKKERITSQDVDFILKLMTGVNDGKL